MVVARIPTWWLDLGADAAGKLGKLFARVMEDLPMSQAELAKAVKVDQSTVARWANGRTTPPPELMLKAVKAVQAHAENLLQRANTAHQALQHVAAAQEAVATKGFGAGGDDVKAMNKLLEDLGIL